MSEHTYSHEGAECPACGYVTGDCFEWLNDESMPIRLTPTDTPYSV